LRAAAAALHLVPPPMFVFFGKRRSALKVMFWDGSGLRSA
jgi:hypothetical protein